LISTNNRNRSIIAMKYVTSTIIEIEAKRIVSVGFVWPAISYKEIKLIR
jgi:hypothetical protein